MNTENIHPKSEDAAEVKPVDNRERFLFYLKKFAKYLGFFVLGVIGVILVAAIFRIPLPLILITGIVEDAAESALDRKVAIGRIFLVPGLQPEVELTELQIDNPPEIPDGKLARVDSISADIDLLALFDRRIHIGDIAVSGIKVDLDALPDGKNNWTFAKGQRHNTKYRIRR